MPNEEIEIKIQVSSENEQYLLTWLQKNACFKGQILQREYYLDNPKNSWFLRHELGYRYALKYLRVRFTKNGDFVCFKNWETGEKPGEAGLFCKDIEYQVSSGEQAVMLFQSLGFTDITKFSKLRRAYHYHDFEISIDSVDGLGTFFEFEIKNRQYAQQAKEYHRLISFIENDLKLSSYKVQKQGFIVLLWNLDFAFSEG